MHRCTVYAGNKAYLQELLCCCVLHMHDLIISVGVLPLIYKLACSATCSGGSFKKIAEYLFLRLLRVFYFSLDQKEDVLGACRLTSQEAQLMPTLAA